MSHNNFSNKTSKTPEYTAPAVTVAANVLRYLSGHRVGPRSLADISDAIGANRSTCYRVLHTLRANALVSYNPSTKQYSVGPYLIVLGERAKESTELYTVIADRLGDIVESTKLTAVLAQRVNNDEFIYLSKNEPHEHPHISVMVGQSFPLTAGSHGKCFLAWMEPKEVRKVLRRIGLPRYTERSITDPDQYLAELNKVREVGYAVSIEEHFPGIFGIAVPILDPKAHAEYVITSIGMANLVTPSIIQSTVSAMTRVANQIIAQVYGPINVKS